MLTIHVPLTYEAERKYVFDVVFGDLLGIPYNLVFDEIRDVRITTDGFSQVVLPDVLFQTPQSLWLLAESLPKQPLFFWTPKSPDLESPLESSRVPVIYGRKEYLSAGDERRSVHLPIDIFGSAFFMLTRYEEAVKSTRDHRDRFPVTAALAYQEGFLDRPVINEYVEILWAAMKRLWPMLPRKQRQFRVFLTHDVDTAPVTANKSWLKFMQNEFGDILKRRSLLLALQRYLSRNEARRNLFHHGPSNTFDFIMETSERYGLSSTFFFISDAHEVIQGDHYDLAHPWMKNLIACIHRRGHAIGIHPSHGAYCRSEVAKGQLEYFTRICEEIDIPVERMGSRQHELQWLNPTTWRICDELGLEYDTSLMFVEQPGFRCGLCHEYPAFDLLRREKLGIKERPLIVMDTTLQKHLKWKPLRAQEYTTKLSRVCRKFNGDFTGLWHNCKLISPKQKVWYVQTIESIMS